MLCVRLALLGGSEQPALLSRAGAQGLADGRLAFLPYDTLLFTLPYCNRSYPAPGDRRHLQEACGAVLSAWSPASDTRTLKLPGPQRGGCPPGAGAGSSVQTFAGPGARGHGQVCTPLAHSGPSWPRPVTPWTAVLPLLWVHDLSLIGQSVSLPSPWVYCLSVSFYLL